MTNTKSPASLFLGIFVFALLSVAGLWFAAKRLGAPANLDLGKIFLVPSTDSLKLLYGADTSNGIVAEFFEPSTKHKFGLARADLSGGALPPPSDLLKDLIEYQGSRTIPEGINPFLIKFVGAQFDARRAYGIEDRDLSVESSLQPHRVLSFVTNRGANYALTILQDSVSTTVVIAMHKDSPVDLAALGAFISQLRFSPTPSVPD